MADIGGQQDFCVLAAGQYDLAIEQLKKTLELQPDFTPAHVQLGRAFVRKGLYEKT